MFHSSLASEMESFLELRSNSICDGWLNNTKYTLELLDQYLTAHRFEGRYLTEEVLVGWIKSLRGKSKTIQIKVICARGFVKYLNALGIGSFLPDVPKTKSDYIPYLYSDKEITAIFYYADNLKGKGSPSTSNYYKLIIPMVLRILYGCGTRLGETMSLRRGDIDFKNQTIFFKHAKFSKERLIPGHDSLFTILECYCLAIGVMQNPEAYLFPGKRAGTHLSTRQVLTWFNKILGLAGIEKHRKTQGERGANLHCFRHLFVMKSMQQMEASGYSISVNDLILPTYLGHECLLDTDVYMRFSGAQVPESIHAFESYSSGLIPNVEVPDEES